MTIRELKTMVNSIPEEYLDKTIIPTHEDDHGGSYCKEVVFDLGEWFDDIRFHITTLQTEKAVKYHDGWMSWDKVEIFAKELQDFSR